MEYRRLINKFSAVELVFFCTVMSAQTKLGTDEKMSWWNDAKFGLFIHWGPYSLYGGVYNGFNQNRGGCEWIMNRCKIPVMEYKAKASTFMPTDFDADKIVLMAKDAGMKYIVFTTKHHDGFAMFQSNASNFNIVDYTKFGRDIVDELAQACRRHEIKLGFYYSQSQDWNNPGGAAGRKDMSEGWPNPDSTYINNFTKAHHGHWDYRQEEQTFDEYFHKVALPQVKELLTRYPDVAIFFFDTPMNITDSQASEMMALFEDYPQVIVNDRLRRPNFPGDYKTPEGRIPKIEDVEGVYWETCMNIGSSWGYKSWENKWKSSDEIIRTLTTIAARGGNLLLNVGPDSKGNVPENATVCLSEVGKWMSIYGESVHGTIRSGIESNCGECSRKDDLKRTIIYLFATRRPDNGKVTVALPVPARKAVWMKDGSPLKISRKGGNTVIDLPAQALESLPVNGNGGVEVIKIELSRKLPAERLRSNSDRFFRIMDE